MGKYRSFAGIFQDADDQVTFSFSDLEMRLGFPLPTSARRHREWWGNDPTHHVQARDGWLAAGRVVTSVDFDSGSVTFARNDRKRLRLQAPGRAKTKRNDAISFQERARQALSSYFKTTLTQGAIHRIPKVFDYVSADKTIVGDAKYLTLVRSRRLPPAKFSVIAEHVWLLEKTKAETKFLIFGNDRRVPEQWLRRYGKLFSGVDFLFLDNRGHIEKLRQTDPTKSEDDLPV